MDMTKYLAFVGAMDVAYRHAYSMIFCDQYRRKGYVDQRVWNKQGRCRKHRCGNE